jgi:hypothetical protein
MNLHKHAAMSGLSGTRGTTPKQFRGIGEGRSFLDLRMPTSVAGAYINRRDLIWLTV